MPRVVNLKSYCTPWRFNGKEYDQETGNYYYGARYYDPKLSIWLSVDPLAEQFPAWSPYNFSLNNPINLVDPDGNAPGDPPRFGGSFGLTLSSGGHFRASLGFGTSYQSGSFMVSAMASNFGLGTRHGSTGSMGMHGTLVGSLALTGGGGQAALLSLNTFANSFATGVTNSFKNSGTLGSNFAYSTAGGFQRVGYAGFRFGDVQGNFYNDVIPGLGSRGDEYWTGGGSLQFSTGNGSSITLGSDVFTGIRFGKNEDTGEWLLNGGNPAGGNFGTYLQSPKEQLLNNGQTYLRFENGQFKGVGAVGGQNHMYSQDFIHNNLSGDPLFQSTANGL